MRLAAAFVNSTPLDWAGNSAAIRSALDEARAKEADIVCLPELCISGYGCEDAFLAPDTAQRAFISLLRLLPATQGLVVSLGLPVAFENALYNCAALCVDGRLLALIPKQNLALQGIHYEPRWFKAWPSGRRDVLAMGGVNLPIGDYIARAGAAAIGFEICEDAWVKERPAFALKARGANIILAPAASHFALGKMQQREALASAAVDRGLAYVYANLMGNEAGRAIYDGGALVWSARGAAAKGERFSYKSAGVVAADVDLLPTKKADGELVFEMPYGPDRTRKKQFAMASLPMKPEEEFTRAVALGLFDYLRKSKAKGYTLSLSGGVDSAACALLVSAMKELGQAELGKETFWARLGASEPLLRCVYQATAQSGSVTREAARGLCQALEIPFFEFEIEPLVGQYRSLVEKALGRPLSWEDDDLTLQNLQARVRSPGVWALANATQTLLIATNNRSEAAAGYTTMDGDSSGGIAPLAGIGKDFLREWLRHAETKGQPGIKPLPALKAINTQAPTAELRPAAAAQTDEGDLMPYAVLDAIEQAALVDRVTPIAIFESLRLRFSELEPAELARYIERYFQLFARSQWKRERLAPSFQLDDHNVDPRTGQRFPILNGGFEAELAELRAHLSQP